MSNFVEKIDQAEQKRLYRKISWRLLPLLFALYIIAYLDRVNIGFAKLQMMQDLAFSDSIYGLGAGLFFLGYFLFEVPSNLILHRVGAKLWIARIAIIWGLISVATSLINSANDFYFMRFLLGIGEAGFFPGVIYYLTLWYPNHYRAKALSLFMIAIPMSGMIGSPISGWLMQQLEGYYHFHGWQWLFILEGLPAVLFGMICYLYLEDRPETARWLTQSEKILLNQSLEQDHLSSTHQYHTFNETIKSIRIWQLAGIYFLVVIGLYGLAFWLPQIIRDLTHGSLLLTGQLNAIPYFVAIGIMLIIGYHSDQKQERCWHLIGCIWLASLGFILSVIFNQQLIMVLLSFSMVAAGILSVLVIFWAIPSEFLSGRAAASGIALINSIGNLGGYLSPVTLGWLKQYTANMNSGLLLIAAGLLLASWLSFNLFYSLSNLIKKW
jgi:sugar phosphate permease